MKTAIEPECVWQVCTLEEHLQWLQVGNILGLLVTDFFADSKHQRATSVSLVLCAWLIAQACQPFKCCTSLQANGLNEISCFSLCHWVFTDRHCSSTLLKILLNLWLKKAAVVAINSQKKIYCQCFGITEWRIVASIFYNL